MAAKTAPPVRPAPTPKPAPAPAPVVNYSPLVINTSGQKVVRVALDSPTSINLANGFDGQSLLLIIRQDQHGDWPVKWVNALGASGVNLAKNSVTRYFLVYDANDNAWCSVAG